MTSTPSMTVLRGTATPADVSFASATTASLEQREHGRLNTPDHARVAERTTETICTRPAFPAIVTRAIAGQLEQRVRVMAGGAHRSVAPSVARRRRNRRLLARYCSESPARHLVPSGRSLAQPWVLPSARNKIPIIDGNLLRFDFLCRWRRKRVPKWRRSGALAWVAVLSEPFPLIRKPCPERPGAVKSAPLLGAAKRTLDGEDRSEMIGREGKAGANGWRNVVRHFGTLARRL